jgi:hypothetical protein
VQLTNKSGFDFGQPLRILARNDVATQEDDLATEYQYAASAAPTPIFGLVASEAKRALLADDATSGDFLAYNEKNYDGLPLGQSTAGNPTRVAQYDGPSPVAARPATLRIATRYEYLDSLCPGHISKTTDPAGFSTQTTFDATCGFALQTENALGHQSQTRYYGVPNPATPLPRVIGAYGTFVFNGRYGQVAQSIDANQAHSLSTYDEWGRALAVWSPLDRSDRPGVRFEYA